MIDKGLGRIDKELDVVQFLRTQIQIRVVMSLLFTRAERFLIRHNRRFVIDSEDTCRHSKEEPSEIDLDIGMHTNLGARFE